MKLSKYIHKTPLFEAVNKCNSEIVKLLLANNKTDINTPYILIYWFIYKI